MFAFEGSEPERLRLNSVLTEGLHKTGLDSKNDDSTLSINQLIQRTIKQKGSFLNVTEDSLLKEISELESNYVDKNNDLDANVDLQESQNKEEVKVPHELKTHEEFMKQKEQIISSVHSALNESSLSLDFISLLISCVRPQAGSLSMSPHLKQHIKIGSLSSDRVQPSENQNLSQIESSKIGRGWKLESLNRSAQNLKNSSLRLRDEIEKEKNYWNGLIEVLKSNEVITTTVTKSSKEISVKYGFGDAGSNYYDKGIGLMKKNPIDGKLYFEKVNPHQSEKTNKLVNVKLYNRNGSDVPVLIGESDLFHRVQKFTAEGVTQEISKARFFLFEEELFYQLVKEAATLVSLQVTIESNKIFIDLHDEIIEIETVALEDVTPVNPELASNKRADQIDTFLRLMLCCEHKNNLDKKKFPPLALSQDQHLSSSLSTTLSLLRPIITYNKHDRTLKQVEDVLILMLTTFYNNDKAKVDEIMSKDYKLIRFCNDPNMRRLSATKLVNNNAFIRCVSSPSTLFKLFVENLKIVIRLRSLSNSSYSTINMKIYNVSETSGSAKTSNSLLNVNFTDVSQLDNCLNWAVAHYSTKIS